MTAPTGGRGSPMGTAGAVVASYVGVVVYAGLVFLGAWKLRYWQGCLYLALALAGTTLSHLLVPRGSALTAARAREAGAGEVWDRRLLTALFLINAVTFVTAGLDSGRFGWSGPVPAIVTVAGAALMLAGQTLFALAKRENPFFSSTVRLQAERGHAVCDTGLYRFVRHPGYLGMLVSQLAFPMVMGAYWAFIPAAAGAAALVVRTRLEDRFLLTSLAGYADYAARTRWRLVRGVF